MQWYYSRQGTQRGPLSEKELLALVRWGQLAPTDLVWSKETGGSWKPASSVERLHDAHAAYSGPEGSLPGTPGAADPVIPGGIPNRELMIRALASLRGRWDVAISAVLVEGILLELPNFLRFLIDPAAFLLRHHGGHHAVSARFLAGIVVLFASSLFTNPLFIGVRRFFLNLARGTAPGLRDLFIGFRQGSGYYWRSVGLPFLIGLMMLGWTLLALIPAWVVGFGWTLPWKGHPSQPHDPVVFAILLATAILFLLIKRWSYAMAPYVLADNPSAGILEAVRRSVRMMEGRIGKFVLLGLRFLGWLALALLTCGIGLLWVLPYMATAAAGFYDDVKGRADIPDTASSPTP